MNLIVSNSDRRIGRVEKKINCKSSVDSFIVVGLMESWCTGCCSAIQPRIQRRAATRDVQQRRSKPNEWQQSETRVSETRPLSRLNNNTKQKRERRKRIPKGSRKIIVLFLYLSNRIDGFNPSFRFVTAHLRVFKATIVFRVFVQLFCQQRRWTRSDHVFTGEIIGH